MAGARKEQIMTAIRGHIEPSAKGDALGIHSLDQFVLSVPDVSVAEKFYRDFGLDVRSSGNGLALRTFGNAHRWGGVIEGERKRLHHLSFGCYAVDLSRLKARIEGNGIKLVDPPPGLESNGFWFVGFDNVLTEIKVAAKSSPDQKADVTWPSALPGEARAPLRKSADVGKPRRLAHVLIFTSDVDNAVDFYTQNLGLKLSDRSADIVAFMHAIHGSDHHVLAFGKSDAPGMHHCSWDVGSIGDIGLGAMNMADRGYTKGWGLGRHALGSNFFHYVRDPWGSYCEYSCDIDYIPSDHNWNAGTHDPEDSLYLWGPELPKDFVLNYESPNVGPAE
jgi:catechol 2,3-dioxygenase-like lactoylglutathione lyase family enzyme